MDRSAAEGGPLVLLGGSFDPVHHGHLRMALELGECLGPDAEVRLLLARQHALKDRVSASDEDRLRMLELAVAGQPGLVVDASELSREGPTRTVETLEMLRKQVGSSRSLVFAMGGDAWQTFDQWHRFVDIPGLANIIVMKRPSVPELSPAQGREILPNLTVTEATDLRNHVSGHFATVALTPLAISSTSIRSILQSGRTPRYLLPEAVLAYIRSHHLYEGDH